MYIESNITLFTTRLCIWVLLLQVMPYYMGETEYLLKDICCLGDQMISLPTTKGTICNTNKLIPLLKTSQTCLESLTMTSMQGDRCLIVVAMPASNPPPPTGITIASGSIPIWSICSKISKAAVPCPARMSGWSYLEGDHQNKTNYVPRLGCLLTATGLYDDATYGIH